MKIIRNIQQKYSDKYSTEIFNISNTTQSHVNIREKYTVQIFHRNIPNNEIEATDSSGIIAS